jgi:hypothetical protein
LRLPKLSDRTASSFDKKITAGSLSTEESAESSSELSWAATGARKRLKVRYRNTPTDAY